MGILLWRKHDDGITSQRRTLTKRRARVENETAAVLQTRHNRPDDLTAYSVRVYLRDEEKPLSENYATIVKPDEIMHSIRVSKSFDPGQFERIEVIRQRHDIRLIREIPIMVDLRPKTE